MEWHMVLLRCSIEKYLHKNVFKVGRRLFISCQWQSLISSTSEKTAGVRYRQQKNSVGFDSVMNAAMICWFYSSLKVKVGAGSVEEQCQILWTEYRWISVKAVAKKKVKSLYHMDSDSKWRFSCSGTGVIIIINDWRGGREFLSTTI